jgi:hypothetical protein
MARTGRRKQVLELSDSEREQPCAVGAAAEVSQALALRSRLVLGCTRRARRTSSGSVSSCAAPPGWMTYGYDSTDFGKSSVASVRARGHGASEGAATFRSRGSTQKGTGRTLRRPPDRPRECFHRRGATRDESLGDSSITLASAPARDGIATLSIARAGREPVERRTQVSDGPALSALLVARREWGPRARCSLHWQCPKWLVEISVSAGPATADASAVASDLGNHPDSSAGVLDGQ